MPFAPSVCSGGERGPAGTVFFFYLLGHHKSHCGGPLSLALSLCLHRHSGRSTEVIIEMLLPEKTWRILDLLAIIADPGRVRTKGDSPSGAG
jgi:hypothetical protein